MKQLILFLFINLSYCQSSIVAAGGDSYTAGEVIPIMQQDAKEKEISLSIPKFEIPVEPKPVTVSKKKSFFQNLIEALLKIFKK